MVSDERISVEASLSRCWQIRSDLHASSCIGASEVHSNISLNQNIVSIKAVNYIRVFYVSYVAS